MKGTDIELYFNLECIYDKANFVLNDKDKVGIIGVNGAGKTTLFKVILGEIKLDSGSITNNKKIGYLPQEISYDDMDSTVFEYLLCARPIKKYEEEITKLYEKLIINPKEEKKILKEISKLETLLDYYDRYKYEEILLKLIEDMNIDLNLLDMKLNLLSGGQKSKIAFAHLLYSKKEVILLDEPTNHIDLETRKYIADYLKNYNGMVLIISHDVNFLNEITTKTLHIDKVTHKITVYEGNYDAFYKKYNALKEIKEKLIEKQEKEEDKLKKIVLLYSNSSGKRKKMAQSREKMLEKKQKEKLTKDIENKKVNLDIKIDDDGSKIPLIVNNLTFSYDNKKNIINNLSFLINKHERFLIVGHNGVGKSTLLKLITNNISPLSGNIKYGNKTTISYYAQEQENLDLTKNILENFSEDYSEKQIRTILASFLFTGDDVYKKCSILSPGEKARLCLCKVLLKKANLLLLDEPTNHLDPETVRIIANNFKNYKGTIILVSHNKEFIESIGIDRMLVLPSGKVTNYTKERLDESLIN